MRLGWLLLCLVLAPALAAAQVPRLLARAHFDAAPLALSDGDRQWLAAKKQLLVGVAKPDIDPFEMLNTEGEYEGLTADVLGVVAEALGLGIQVKVYPDRQALVKGLVAGDIDLMGTANSLAFAQPGLVVSRTYVEDNPVLVRSMGHWVGLDDQLAGQRLAFNSRYLDQEQVKRLFPKARLQPFVSPLDALSAVALGKADAMLANAVSAYYLSNRYYPNEVRVTRLVATQGATQGFGFALRQDEPRLLRLVNQALAAIPAGQLRTLQDRWSGGGVLRSARLALTPEEQAWVAAHALVKVGVSSEFAPISYIGEDGNYHGVTSDLLSVIGVMTGLHFEIHPYDKIPKGVQDLQAGVLDMAADYGATAQRRQRFLFSRSYLGLPFVLVTRQGKGQPSALADMKGKTLALPQGVLMVPWFQEHHPEIRLRLTPTIRESFVAVSKGDADATIRELNSARFYVARQFSDSLKMVALPEVEGQHLSFVVRKDEPLLKAVLDKALLNISPEELSVLINRWRSNIAPPPSSWRDYMSVIISAVAVVLVLMLAAAAWNLALRRLIARKRKAELALNDQLRFMDTLINGTPHPIYARDRAQRLVICNDSYLAFLGIGRQEAMGSDRVGLGRLSAQDEQAIRQSHQAVLASGEAMLLDRVVCINGKETFIYQWFQPYGDAQGQAQGVIGGWIDISDRRAMVAELSRAKEEADRANKAKSTFLATMSHEIRTPMNAILGMLELALRRARVGQPDRDSLELAHDSARGLLALLGDILDISRIESGQLDLFPKPTELQPLLAGIIRVFEGLARQKGLNLVLEASPLPTVQVDPLRLKQVLFNLVGNAIKFTEAGEVRLEACGQGQGADFTLQLAVSDTGIGISKADQQKLFSAFSQVGNQGSGSGLGLMISRTLCQMMGGSLALDSEPGRGTRAKVVLPLPALAGKGRGPEEEGALPPLAAMKVLVVDDHPVNRQLLGQQLAILGHRVALAVDGEEGLALWRQGGFDLVVTDCNMPKMNGFELAGAIRSEERQAGLAPCLLLGFTANAQPEARQRCLDAGMDDCLFKPIALADLHGCLAQLQAARDAASLLDIRVLRQLMAHDEGRLKALLLALKDANHKDCLALVEAGGDRQALAELAHRIKGAARMVQAGQLVSRCEALELACAGEGEPDGPRAALLAALDALDRELDALLKG
ncbi:transporter substrate-binding domain-containing protein [Gallaecimonas kandeliae]|uniref:transporter substrate-binding domain-containing protein n=1 Tax=Gallaecimonas kandeliae TaxID=3029055 RepID=UPI0026481F15|nr:transporter substrate-binding domain-containing protein [Gallaecimonas kandeliae]WKE67009.1 transporter substrate-binding domain-containing protein [Gallaecimonas kandeliae]